jgi:hypothetical protein
MPTEPEIPQQFQALYWLVLAPIAAGLTRLLYLLGKRRKGGERDDDDADRRKAEKERDALKEEVAALLRKDERNQTNRDIAIACREIEQRFNMANAALRGDLETAAEKVVKAVRESLEGQIKTLRDDVNKKLAGLRRLRRAPNQPK